MREHVSAQLQRFRPLRIVAVGSSNTERAGHSDGQYNWFDWLDLALREVHGRQHHSINVGVSGETSAELIARFDDAVAVYQPHLVLLTVGGNDADPQRAVDRDTYYRQLLQLVQRIKALPDSLCVLQTYYSPIAEDLDTEYVKRFHEYMQLVRDVAAEESIALIDNLQRWERLRSSDPRRHRLLMRDPLHVNPLGNMLWGMDVARCLGVDVARVMRPWCAEALALQSRIDQLGAAHVEQ